jgi:hypothetical protein
VGVEGAVRVDPKKMSSKTSKTWPIKNGKSKVRKGEDIGKLISCLDLVSHGSRSSNDRAGSFLSHSSSWVSQSPAETTVFLTGNPEDSVMKAAKGKPTDSPQSLS